MLTLNDVGSLLIFSNIVFLTIGLYVGSEIKKG